MFRSNLASAFRSLRRGPVYALVSILGLALGLCAALMAGAVVHNQLSFDRFIPGYDRVHLVVSSLAPQGRPAQYVDATHNKLAALLKTRGAEFSTVTRLAGQTVQLRNGELRAPEKIYWADENLFEVLPFPVVAGNARTALQNPHGIVLTRSMARKYFGSDAPIGERIELGGERLMTVLAVIEDLPVNATTFETGVFASGRAGDSLLSSLDSNPAYATGGDSFMVSVRTYVRLTHGASIDRARATLDELLRDMWPRQPPGLTASMHLIRLDEVHTFEGFNPKLAHRIAGVALVGTLILLIACMNFVNLATARAGRRAQEIGIRKAVGASRSMLVIQFIGETFMQVLAATLIAMLFAPLALTIVNDFAGTAAVLDYVNDAALLLWICVGMIVVTALAGFYPALVLSSFRPATAVRAGTSLARPGTLSGRLLVALQFSILIALMIATTIVYRQREFATKEAVRVDTQDVLVIEAPCDTAFKTELGRRTDVSDVSCTDEAFLRGGVFANLITLSGKPAALDILTVQDSAFSTYGVEVRKGDWLRETDASLQGLPYVIVNESAARVLGFVSAETAVGKRVTLPPFSPGDEEQDVTIAGFVRDFSLASVTEPIKPTIYDLRHDSFSLIHLKIESSDLAGTLAEIDELWARTGQGGSMKRYFVDEYLSGLYRDVLREAQTFSMFACIAALLACVGMAALSAATTEYRTKEIGVRKALGANTADIVRLLVWQFSKPVLWANLIAWPVAGLLMNRWLSGFAYHVDLGIEFFVLAAAAAFAVAALTVSFNCYTAARARPVVALRYE